MMTTFTKELEQLSGRSTTMGTEEYLLQKSETEGIEKGEARKNHSVVENLITKLGLSDEQAADIAEVSIDYVKKIRKKLAARK